MSVFRLPDLALEALDLATPDSWDAGTERDRDLALSLHDWLHARCSHCFHLLLTDSDCVLVPGSLAPQIAALLTLFGGAQLPPSTSPAAPQVLEPLLLAPSPKPDTVAFGQWLEAHCPGAFLLLPDPDGAVFLVSSSRWVSRAGSLPAEAPALPVPFPETEEVTAVM